MLGLSFGCDPRQVLRDAVAEIQRLRERVSYLTGQEYDNMKKVWR